MKSFMLLLFSFVVLQASAQTCPVDDSEAAFKVKTAGGLTLVLCGFEDRDVPSVKGKRAFSEFTVFSTPKTADQKHAKVFIAEESETYWVKELAGKGLEVEELWFFDDKPKAALRREVTCTADACSVSEPKCVFKPTKNPFPKALAEFQQRLKDGKLGEDGEELIDQIFAQAMAGDGAAKEFYTAAKAPALDKALSEVFATNRKKLQIGCKP